MLKNCWYIACPSRKLKNRPVARTLFGRRLVFFRSESGQVSALDDCCPHRNAPLSAGEVADGQLACPYHGWRFDRQGRLVEIPYRAGTPPDCSIHQYDCVEQDGYVWVCPGDKVPEEAPLVFPHLGLHGWTSFRMETLFAANVEAYLENFLDCPHATHVHRYWFRTPTAKPVMAQVTMLEDGAVAEYFQEPREKSLVWSLLSPSPHRSPTPWFRRFWAPGRGQDRPIAHFSCQGTRQEKRFSCFSLSQELWRMFF